MFRLSKHRAKLREMLANLNTSKTKSQTVRELAKKSGIEVVNVPLVALDFADLEIRAAAVFSLTDCKNGTNQCLIPIKCTDAGRCPYGKH